MKRKEFIKTVAIASPFALSLPSLLASCKKKETNCENSWTGKVIVIGAGAAGLYAAKLLHDKKIEVEILEASSVIGGRIRPLKTFADFEVELGAEEVHGANSTWYRIVKESGAFFINNDTDDYFFYNGSLQKIADINSQSDVKKCLDFVDATPDYSGADVPLQNNISLQGDISKTDSLYNALIGNEYGADNLQIGALSLAEEEKKSKAGSENFAVSNKSLLRILSDTCNAILPKVKLNTSVKKIDYQGSLIQITDTNNNAYSADKVLVTVPLTILKSSSITFLPALPADKKDAISIIGMGAGMKIILKFSASFWPANTGSIYGIGYVPEFWVSSDGRSNSYFTLSAFVMGQNATYLSSQGTNATNIVVQELDNLFGGNAASSKLVDSFIQDWSKEPHILGAYSYPSIGSAPMRSVLGSSVSSKIYFAGEATNIHGSIGTVHGAIESAEDAIKAILCS